jgi:hypothetical protein
MIWLLAYRKAIRYYVLYTIVAAVLFITDVVIDHDQSIVGLSIIGACLFYVIILWAGYFEKSIKFMTRRKKIADRFLAQSFIITYTFSENYVEYQDNEKYYRFNWSVFNPYTLQNDNVIMRGKDTDGVLFSFSKKDLSDEDYREILSILNNKIGQKDPGKLTKF